ncbi:9013_t:CDS:2 [Cetraspora pellucida]|uniref:9013_t:CDS:1 n=1 Tax=Cetraspora pellucida TaxID=1433469 RepID=A0A9N9F2W9_9GLOM|nr:9013_t:CDS:2 [Cetraspora pellucida]
MKKILVSFQFWQNYSMQSWFYISLIRDDKKKFINFQETDSTFFTTKTRQ